MQVFKLDWKLPRQNHLLLLGLLVGASQSFVPYILAVLERSASNREWYLYDHQSTQWKLWYSLRRIEKWHRAFRMLLWIQFLRSGRFLSLTQWCFGVSMQPTAKFAAMHISRLMSPWMEREMLWLGVVQGVIQIRDLWWFLKNFSPSKRHIMPSWTLPSDDSLQIQIPVSTRCLLCQRTPIVHPTFTTCLIHRQAAVEIRGHSVHACYYCVQRYLEVHGDDTRGLCGICLHSHPE